MITKDKINKISWDEYFKEELEVLTKKVEKYIKDNKIKIDAVVPILRGGNIPGTYLAYKLKILKILPVQYKYFFKEDVAELKQIQKIDEKFFDKDEKLTFLLVEGNHCFGTSASYAAKGLKEQFPNCEIIYAASNMDYNYQDAIKDAKVAFYGRLQNDCEECTKEQCKKLGLKFDEFDIFPWENVEEELTTLKMKQFEFRDNNDTEKISEFKESFDLDELSGNN